MTNPIINNRIVSSKTFAVRFKSFVESVTVQDACGEDEKEAMLNVANSLLVYQLHTIDANDTEETEYLERIGIYPLLPILVTHDGVELHASETGAMVYSSMIIPRLGDEVRQHTVKNSDDIKRINPKRIIFWNKKEAESYIEFNTKSISIQDLINANLYQAYEQSKSKGH